MTDQDENPQFEIDEPNDPRFFIRLRNWDQFQYLDSGRPRKDREARPRWARLHISMLLSSDWLTSDAETKAFMIALIILAAQNDNRIRNDHAYLARICGFDSEADIRGPFLALYRAGNRGFFGLTLDGEPDEEQAEVKRAKPRPKLTSKRFDDFWKVYPNRKDKKAARARWEKNDLDQHADAIIAAVLVQAKQDAWTKDNGQFIPLPSTYLNKERWLDEGTTVGRQSGDLPENAPGARGY